MRCGSTSLVAIVGDHVVRVQRGQVKRPKIPVVLQPTETIACGPYTVEILPLLTPAERLPRKLQREGFAIIRKNIPRGYTEVDLHLGNFGFSPEHGWKIFDPEALQ
jgi:hypothetical protein